MPPLAHDVFVQTGSDLWAKLGTVATLLAVLVALFGPLIVDRLRRPRLKVTIASDLISTLASAPAASGRRRLAVNITNHGRRQANDVQVFLTVETPIEVPGMSDTYRIETFQTPIPFFHHEGGDWTPQYSVAIPPGFSRPLQILVEDMTGFLLASPSEHNPAIPDPRSFELENGAHRVVLDIVGSNLKVIRLEGELQTTDEPSRREAKWSKPLKVVRYRVDDPLPS
jgi:hypothetical protein